MAASPPTTATAENTMLSVNAFEMIRCSSCGRLAISRAVTVQRPKSGSAWSVATNASETVSCPYVGRPR